MRATAVVLLAGLLAAPAWAADDVTEADRYVMSLARDGVRAHAQVDGLQAQVTALVAQVTALRQELAAAADAPKP